MKFELDIAGNEIVEEHKKDLQAKYVGAFTNINNIKSLIKGLEKELEITEDENKRKMIETSILEQGQILKSNEDAVRLHKKNILFLNKELGVQ